MIIMPVNMAGNRYRPPARYHRQNMTRHCMAVRGSDFWQGSKSRQQLAHDYILHIVSHFAAERMKHVKQRLEEVLSNYRAGGPVWREYPHDAGMAGKTKATTKGSPVEIKEIKCITNYAMSVAGGQGYQSGGRFLPDLSRRGYFSTKSSRAKRFCGCFFTPGRGVNSSGSDISLARFSSSWRSSMRCKSRLRCSAKISVVDLYFLVMVLSCKAICRTASHYGTNGFYSFHGVEALKSGHYLFLGEINRRGYLSRNASSA
ncbi:hypothetical protein ACTDTV_001879, partial [Escherichia coli]